MKVKTLAALSDITCKCHCSTHDSCQIHKTDSCQIDKNVEIGKASFTKSIHTANLTMLGKCIRHLDRFTFKHFEHTRQHLRSCTRSYASLLDRERKIADREDNVYQFAELGSKRPNYVHVWGNATTGSLGVREFVKPPKGVKKNPKYQQISPYRQTFFDQYLLKVQDVACGYGYSVFLCKAKDDKSHVIYGCGINTDSQLGYQEYPKNTGRVLDYVTWPAVIDLPLMYKDETKFIQVSCGRAHTFILSDKEGLFSFGNNSYGQCGRNVVVGEKRSGNKVVNKIPFEHGQIKQVECGQDHTLILTTTGEVYSCGLSSDGQTGVGHYNNVESFTKVIGDIEGEKIVQISSKVDCALAVSEKGDIFGWGNSEYEQLSVVAKDSTQVNVSHHLPFKNVGKVSKVASAGSMCALMNENGSVHVWGFGLLGKGPQLQQSAEPCEIPMTLFGQNEFRDKVKVVDITCGIAHFSALTSEGLLYNWGKNRMGCLGFGNKHDQAFPYQVSLGTEVIKSACGVDHMVVLSKSVV